MTQTDTKKMIQPARRLSLVKEYYFSRKLKEVAKMDHEGLDVISLAIGSPDMPPSAHVWHARAEGCDGRILQKMVRCRLRCNQRNPAPHRQQGRNTAHHARLREPWRQSARARPRLSHIHLVKQNPRCGSCEIQPPRRKLLAT